MTEIQKRALELLGNGPLTCTELGEQLWAADRNNCGSRQSWARPAGKVLAALKKLGKADRTWIHGRSIWVRTL